MTIYHGGTMVVGDPDVDPDLAEEIKRRTGEIAEILLGADQSLRHHLVGSMLMTFALGEPEPAWAILNLVSMVSEALPDAYEQCKASIEARGSTKQ